MRGSLLFMIFLLIPFLLSTAAPQGWSAYVKWDVALVNGQQLCLNDYDVSSLEDKNACVWRKRPLVDSNYDLNKRFWNINAVVNNGVIIVKVDRTNKKNWEENPSIPGYYIIGMVEKLKVRVVGSTSVNIQNVDFLDSRLMHSFYLIKYSLKEDVGSIEDSKFVVKVALDWEGGSIAQTAAIFSIPHNPYLNHHIYIDPTKSDKALKRIKDITPKDYEFLPNSNMYDDDY